MWDESIQGNKIKGYMRKYKNIIRMWNIILVRNKQKEYH